MSGVDAKTELLILNNTKVHTNQPHIRHIGNAGGCTTIRDYPKSMLITRYLLYFSIFRMILECGLQTYTQDLITLHEITFSRYIQTLVRLKRKRSVSDFQIEMAGLLGTREL